MKRAMRKIVWGSVVTAATALLATPAAAQTAATVVLLDRNAIQANVAPNNFAGLDINASIADIGVRDGLPYFTARAGRPVTLPGGTVGHEGWLVFASVPGAWTPNADTDGLENFIWAGPGLGSPDAAGSRTTLLGPSAAVVPLGVTGLQQLVGQTVCAIAYNGELPRSTAGITLAVPTLGMLAFTVDALNGGTDTTLPFVDVTVRDTREVCGGALAPMANAPAAGF